MTPLILAIFGDHTDMVRAIHLMKAGANLEATDVVMCIFINAFVCVYSYSFSSLLRLRCKRQSTSSSTML